ncbi:MAG: putative lipase, partial [Bacteroidales bacterium]|nr:putative lipase [Bacteroidales bacterium]
MNKKLLTLLITTIVMANAMQAQNMQTFTQMFDSIFINVSRTDATTGILYERVVPFANLFRFTNPDTADVDIFLQGYSELYRATFIPTARLPYDSDSLKRQILKNTNIVDIALLHYRFNNIDSAAARQKLYVAGNGLIAENTNISSSLYLESTILCAAPLIKRHFSSSIVYRLSDIFRFDNTGNAITQLQVDFGDETGLHFFDLNSSFPIEYAEGGIKIIHLIATLANGTLIETYSKIEIVLPKVSKANDNTITNYWISDYNIWQQIPFLDYTGVSRTAGYTYRQGETQILSGIGLVRIYYSSEDKILRKPVLVVDGFDPGNKRKFESNDDGNDHKSIWSMLYYDNDTKHLGDKLIGEHGYDLVVLDLPDGGGYIEQNAMICIELINWINQQLNESGSKEKIVVVGPSMGGQITRYALTYMEKHPNDPLCNYGKHNCRLWISYDSPHQWANISMGAQAFLEYLGYHQSIGPAKDKYEEVLCSIAAKQMLVQHKHGEGGTYRTKWNTARRNNNVATNGYPSFLRKIAVANGSLSGSPSYEVNEELPSFTDMMVPDYINQEHLVLHAYAYYILTSANYFIVGYPDCGETDEVFSAEWQLIFIPIPNTWTITVPINGTCRVDQAPGGNYDTFDQIATQFDDTGGGLTSIYLNKKYHCFMPNKSTLDINGDIDLFADISGMDLVAQHRIPFQSYAGSEDVNMYHVTFNGKLVNYLINEVETYLQGPDTITDCKFYKFNVHLPKDTTATANWFMSSNLSIIAMPSYDTVIVRWNGQGSSAWINAA